jgi:hypothetical protein
MDHLESVKELIKTTSKTYDDIEIITIKLKLKKHEFEDNVYATNKELQRLVPRCFSLIKLNNIELGFLSGMTKFNGYTAYDDDDVFDNQTKTKTKTKTSPNPMFDISEVLEWRKNNELKVIRTKKENGKFCAVRIFSINERILIIYGSKNMHYPIWYDELENYKFSNSLCDYILKDIKTNIDNLIKLKDYFAEYSLCGEFCDGQHFTEGDNTIRWFGLFKNGSPSKYEKFNKICSENNISNTPNEEIEINQSTNIEDIFKLSRCENNEGSVIYLYNVKSLKSYLVKTKSVRYIFMRMFRQLLQKGYNHMLNITKRVEETKEYHCLNTISAIKITNRLLDFGYWLLKNKFNVTTFKMTSTYEKTIGFYTKWKEYIESKTELDDIKITINDFIGEFDYNTYTNGVKLPYKKTEIYDRPKTIFIQGLQGSGKTTIANKICESSNIHKVEQDEFKNSNICLFYYEQVLQGFIGCFDAIIITRCNCYYSQYESYLEIAKKNNSEVVFYSPLNFTPEYFTLAYCGILERSINFQNLKLGDSVIEPRIVHKILLSNYNKYIKHSITNNYKTYNDDFKLVNVSIYKFRTFHKYCVENLELLLKHRSSLNKIISKILSKSYLCDSVIDTKKISNISYNLNEETFDKI